MGNMWAAVLIWWSDGLNIALKQVTLPETMETTREGWVEDKDGVRRDKRDFLICRACML